jgi:tetratricopeptide (TPR) repeat protein
MVGVQAPAKNGGTDHYFSYSLLLYNDGPYFKFSEGFSLFVDCEDAVAEAYQAYRAARPHEQTPPSAFAVGYQFLQSGRVQDALVVFRLNAADFPNDATSQYQLGEAYRFTGQPELAATQYEKTLKLQPDFPQAAARLEVVRPGK